MSNVKLAIRVRPFTERERKSEKDHVQVVNVVDENTVTITNMKVNVSGAGDSRERVRRYYADYTFDSACSMTHLSYASQETVFESIGREVITNLSRGCSACVMAYGQSSTGKTHTMMGTEAQPGLVPRLCRALANLQPFDFTVSFLEIYNERVHDLLVGEAPSACHSLPRRRGNACKDLRVREHPSKGPYVQNLRRVAIHDVEALLSLVSEGASRRRTAATRRNSTSSRSHALLELASPRATLHLADLAGSEKASWEGCGNGRQKEGANINKSLVALSNVISALVSSGNRGRFVPYRDSALTWLLKDCFTGGAITFIIATVSPSITCYGESASTLRWAARARQLPTPKNIGCGSNIASRAVLQAQFSQLIAELARNHIRYIPESGKIFYDEHHWSLRTNEDCKLSNGLDTTAKIGNIMNIKHPKPDANSESTGSSAASGSSDVINIMDKNITNEINKEVDKLFGPALERTSSGSDLKVVAPLRHKRRQYRSQEVLPLDEALVAEQSQNLTNALPSHSGIQINDLQNNSKNKIPHVSILHENQRAEIVASVTERLYSKLKKKEEVAVSRVESLVDKKITEPLSELKICTNARQRLMELSQKALRNKRRIGIPAYTQTRVSVIRVKDQGIDVQTDLESYIVKSKPSYTLYRDVATETMPMTPRCKEKSVGSKYGTLDFHDRSTTTESKQPVYKNSCIMTDVLVTRERFTQTPIVPPPRRRKYMSNSKYVNNDIERMAECPAAPVISINISQTYPADSESQSSDDSSDNLFSKNNIHNNVTITPDLLTNHCDVDTKKDNIEPTKVDIAVNVDKKIGECETINSTDFLDSKKYSDEFSDSEDYFLPRVSVDPARKVNYSEIKDIILGRNENIYPYNIVISPTKEREHSKRIVTFKDIDIDNEMDVGVPRSCDLNNDHMKSTSQSVSDEAIFAKDADNKYLSESINSDSTDSSKIETNSFIWKQGDVANKTMGCLKKKYTPVYKNNPRHRTVKAGFCREFLGLENSEDVNHNRKYYTQFPTYDSFNNISSSESAETKNGTRYECRRQNFVDKFNGYKKRFKLDDIERKIYASCNDLKISVNKYETYLGTYRKGGAKNYGKDPVRTPTEYLQHLVKLRREVVKTEADTTTDSSSNISQS